MKEYRLREHFSIEQDGEMLVGPCNVQLDEKTAELNMHKLESLENDNQVDDKQNKKTERELLALAGKIAKKLEMDKVEVLNQIKEKMESDGLSIEDIKKEYDV